MHKGLDSLIANDDHRETLLADGLPQFSVRPLLTSELSLRAIYTKEHERVLDAMIASANSTSMYQNDHEASTQGGRF